MRTLGVMGACTRRGTLSGREALVSKETPGVERGSPARMAQRRQSQQAARWLGFKIFNAPGWLSSGGRGAAGEAAAGALGSSAQAV